MSLTGTFVVGQRLLSFAFIRYRMPYIILWMFAFLSSFETWQSQT